MQDVYFQKYETHIKRYSMSGNQIWVRSFNLDRNFKEIFMDLKSIAIEHFGEFQG